MKISKLWLITIPILLILFLLAIPTFVVLGKMGFFTPEPTAQVTMTAPEDARELVFVADYDYDPYSYLNEDGTPNGMDVEIAYELANRLGMRPRIAFGTWSECKEKIKNREADILLGLEIFVDGTPTGTLKSIPVGSDTLSIIGKDSIDDAAALSGKRVGVSFGSAMMDLFRLNCEYVQYFTYSEMFEALDKGEVDYGICHASVAIRLIEKNHYKFIPSLILMESFPTMGIRQDEPELQEKINQTLEAMSSDGTIASLREKWIITYVQNKTVGDVFHNYGDFFILYAILSVVLLSAYVVTITLVRTSLIRKKALVTIQNQQKNLEEALNLAKNASQAKTEFLFNMSHDIRTPMNAILGNTDIALHHIENEDKVRNSLKKIKTSGGYLLSLINDILEMSRIEAGRLEIVNAPLNIYEVTESITIMNQALAANKDITFTTVIDNLRNPYVYADELHTNQVIINLISNAIKYTNPGGIVEYHLEQISEPENGMANYRFTVKDNGIGMTEEFQQHLFESFSRENTATVSKQEGAGLGLAIVKRISDLMDGTIRVQSKKNVGSTFIVELPLEVMGAAEIEQFKAEQGNKEEIREDASLEGKRVLLVEDNEMNREIAAEILEETGIHIETAEDGSVAVQMVAQNGADYYDFILMDIQMPVMNGYDATKAIRKLFPDQHIPIIALSANAFTEDKQASLAAGMDNHVAKPINVKELIHVMAKYV